MRRRDFLTAAGAGSLSLIFAPALKYLASGKRNNTKKNTTRTNIVFIMADDLGYGDLGCFGNPIVQSPNLDNLAMEGTVLTQCYSAGPVCMPTRVAFVSGYYPYRTGAKMSRNCTTPSLNLTFFPKLLRDAGYSTFVAGKWHISGFPNGIKEIGFNEWAICAPGGWCDYWDYTKHTHLENSSSGGKYSTDMITDETIAFIDRRKDNSFFAYVAYTAPHFPLQAPAEDIEDFKNTQGLADGAKIVYAMIKRMDAGIGRIIEKLKKENLYENTLIVFTSDNGPQFGEYKGLDQHRYNANLAKMKGYVAEGGIKVPGIIKWPENIKSSLSTFPHMIHTVDWFPTLCGIAGVKVPQTADIDGVDYLPALLGLSQPPNVKRFWAYNKTRPTDKSNAAFRQGPWKLHRPAIEKFNSWDTPADEPLPEDIPDYSPVQDRYGSLRTKRPGQ